MAVLGLCKVFRCAERVALHGLSGDGFPGKSCGAVTWAGVPMGGPRGDTEIGIRAMLEAQDTHSLNRVAERPSETRVG